ncbi:unnamed protein product, partial [Pylaiella littoralis]
ATEGTRAGEEAVRTLSQEGHSVFSKPAILAADKDSASPGKAGESPGVAAATMDASSSAGSATVVGNPTDTSFASSPGDTSTDVIKEEYASTEDGQASTSEMPALTEQSASTEGVAKKTSSYGASVYKLLFGSSKKTSAPEASESVVEEPAPSLAAPEPEPMAKESLVKIGENDSRQGERISGSPAAAAGGDITDNTEAATLDATPDGVMQIGAMNAPAAARVVGDDALSTTTPVMGSAAQVDEAVGLGQLPPPSVDDSLPNDSENAFVETFVESATPTADGDGADTETDEV